jgi:hypothetical protein
MSKTFLLIDDRRDPASTAGSVARELGRIIDRAIGSFSRMRIKTALRALVGTATSLAAALTFLIATTTVRSVTAAEIKYDETRDGIHFLLIKGEIQPGDAEIFIKLANALPPGKVVVGMEGPGGGLRAGLNIGLAIHRRGYGTAAISECASVCAVIWLAGTPRYFLEGAKIGFHAAYVKDDSGNFSETGHGNALVGAYLANLGLSYDAVDYLTSAAPGDMNWLTPINAGRLGIDFAFIPAQHLLVPNPPMPSATLRPMTPRDPPTADIFPHLHSSLLAPAPVAPTSPTAEVSPAQRAASTTPEYAQGRQDRLAYEQWFLSLGSGGAYQEGASFWASNRSLPHPPSCQAKPDPNWQAGCRATRTRLIPIDRRRHSEANYRWGWNSL